MITPSHSLSKCTDPGRRLINIFSDNALDQWIDSLNYDEINHFYDLVTDHRVDEVLNAFYDDGYYGDYYMMNGPDIDSLKIDDAQLQLINFGPSGSETAKYALKESAERAIEALHGQELCGSRLKVMLADPHEKSSKDSNGDSAMRKRPKISE